ncbi:type III pantothenate kinase [Calycomorphotria hydatis]|uniref:type III pantothenate kinase n=1 Tax=Calycomorphotria hydatis TaxID=2528027 RepID=UPI0018D227C0|nr:type III pantothenate kinase [Calycomorphotria hydatis]
MEHLLAVDVGNTRIKFGVLKTSNGFAALPENIDLFAIPVRACDDLSSVRTWLESRNQLGLLTEAVVADVNPMITQDLMRAWREEFGSVPRRVPRPAEELLKNLTRLPHKVGPDRLFNAVAVNQIRSAETPVIIVDSGTATTVDVVDESGAFAGGAILPGFRLSAQALHEYTALLPTVASDDVAEEIPDPLGKDTHSAIRSGLYWGGVGAVKELVQQLCGTFPETPMIILTGGAAPRLLPHLPNVQHYPQLALQGLTITALWEASMAGKSDRDV